MIRYALCCEDGHRFQSWFYDSAAFDEQSERRLVACPVCDSRHVVKAVMAPAVVGAVRERRREAVETAISQKAQVETDSSASVDVTLVDRERRQFIRAFRDKVMSETRDVGRAFADEARRVHGSDAPADRIRGQATLDEARDLIEDGIMVLPLPALPDELN